MSEGGEGEEEIQFLRTVSPAYLLLLGRANLRAVGSSRNEKDKQMNDEKLRGVVQAQPF